jgi:hypothetical protein
MDKTEENKMFSLRLNPKLIERINKLSIEMGASKAKIARSYLQLSDYFLVEPNLDITTFTKLGLSIFPTEILKDLLDSQNDRDQILMGDKLGTIINNNFQIMGLQNLEEKRKLIQGLNWIRFTPVHLISEEEDPKTKEIKKINKQFWGIPKDTWPILVIHAMLFRLIYNQKYNSNWELKLLKDFLSLTEKKQQDFIRNPKKLPIYNKKKDFILKFANEIGARKENFEAEHIYYYFDVLRIENLK